MTRLQGPSEDPQWVMIQILKRENGVSLYRGESESRQVREKEAQIIRDEIRSYV